MKWRSLLPCAGIVGGMVTGWVWREMPPYAEFVQKPPAVLSGKTLPRTAQTSRAAVTELAELQALWDDDGTLEIYDALAGVPAQKLAAWLEQYLPPETYNHSLERAKRDGIREALVARLAECDPAALAAWLHKVPHGYMPLNWLRYAAHGLLEANTPETAAVLARLQKVHPWAAGAEVEWLAKRDPAAALQLALTKRAGLPREVAAWLAADPVEARKIANAHPELSFELIAEFAKQGRAALDDFAAGLTDPRAQKHVERQKMAMAAREGNANAFADIFLRVGGGPDDAVATLVRHHPEAAEALVLRLAEKPSLCAQVLRALAAIEPARAAALIVSTSGSGVMQDGEWRHPVLASLSRAWSLENPAAAQSWLRTLPAETLADVLPAAGDISGTFATAEWLTLTRGLPLDHGGAYGIAQQALSHTTDPAALAEWCVAFPEHSRLHVLEALSSNLGRKDQGAVLDMERRFLEALHSESP